jgi:hypothetical protein
LQRWDASEILGVIETAMLLGDDVFKVML